MFTIKIKPVGAAFTNHISEEIADILDGVARSIREDQPFDPNTTRFDHSLRDSNGNRCGEITYRREYGYGRA